MAENGFHLNDRRRSWAVPLAIVAILALVGVSLWGYYQNRQLKRLQVLMTNQYNRAFVDLSDYVDNVETLMAKSLVTSTPVSTSKMLEEVWRQANLAQTNMGQLPIAPPILEKTSNFLTQAGDMAYSLNNKTMNGIPLNDKEYGALQKLHGYAVSLQKNLHGIEDQITNGKMTWDKYTNKGKFMVASTSKDPKTGQFENIDKTFQEYPTLIYDGPYSDHMLKSKPQGLGDKKVSVSDAKNIAINFIGKNKVSDVKQLENNDLGNIKTYRFKVMYKDRKESEYAEVEVTQQGGQVYLMLSNRNIGKDTVNMGKAKKLAKDFLDSKGYKNMVDTYYQKVDGTAVISYAYKQGGVIVYPDLIKVKIALDNGEIIGIESKGYLYNHRVRTIPKTNITLEQARAKVNNKIKIDRQGEAIIPTNYKTEKYCYEFMGKVNGRNFIIYINALTGAEEDVLMLVTTPEGTLTM
ncbi:germination protein YpeB [Ruminiclostridium cellulolyticum]|uniref:Germination protein YpeB n=1 Tax=Ruminiclostridium cellulolyticum (strain ATCC 35319 / DSM 5812 / JCM 6584 / H10) TaxID=394503 RepID=B8I3U7_RUMCH|nr:germination protein YpeB [Ruminiclostridium cellulolyticum]ACL74424.1 germination protein YpeB [Ruminiclostridium cellulolyticum H10]